MRFCHLMIEPTNFSSDRDKVVLYEQTTSCNDKSIITWTYDGCLEE